MKTFRLLAAAALVAGAGPFAVAVSAQTMDHVKVPGMQRGTVAGTEMTTGEVRKIDKDTQKITLKHGEIKNLAMPGMTMVFKVKDAAMLDLVQVGSKVKFTAEKADGALVLTAFEKVE